jgi:hypothetical protein
VVGIWKTLREVLPPVCRYWWAFSLFVLSDLYLWVAYAVRAWAPTSWMQTVNAPPLWLPLVVMALSLIFALFVTLHIVRKQRDALKSVTDYESALDILGVEFDRGTQILTEELANLHEYGAWTLRWNQWRGDVENFLGQKFGLRERLMFRNSVLVPQHNLGGLNLLHANDRQQVARKLELLREAMLRHCDIAARRRQDLE